MSHFNAKETATIEAIATSLKVADHTPDKELVELFNTIASIVKGMRKNVIEAINDTEEFEVEFNVDLNAGIEAKRMGGSILPEVQITITEQQKVAAEKIFGALAKRFRKKAKTRTMVLTESGYRFTDDTSHIDERRFHRTTIRRQEVAYSPSSYSNIHNFLQKVHRLLTEASRIATEH